MSDVVNKEETKQEPKQEPKERTVNETVERTLKDEMRLREIELGYRLITDSPWGKIRIYKDTARWVSEPADHEFWSKRNELIREGKLPFTEEVRESLEKRGIWTKDHDDEITAISEKIRDMEEQKEQFKGKKLEEFQLELDKLYDDFWNRVAKRDYYFGKTIDMEAEAFRRFCLIQMAVRHDQDGKRGAELDPVFKSIDEIYDLEEKKFDYIRNETQKFWNQGVTEGFLGESPEELTSSSDGK